MEKRVFLIVLDSFGIGAEPDAAAFGDAGTNTLGAIANHPNFNCPNLRKLGLFNIDGVTAGERTDAPAAAFARLQEQSMGKDTTIGHWEIAGVVSPEPLPTFPEGFPEELIREYEQKTGHKVLCNKPYSGTQVLKDYGEQAMRETPSSSTPAPTAFFRWPPTRSLCRCTSCTATVRSPGKCSRASTAWAA